MAFFFNATRALRDLLIGNVLDQINPAAKVIAQPIQYIRRSMG